jgi:hypothetical protein
MSDDDQWETDGGGAFRPVARLCAWCGRWVLGIGYEVNGKTFCSWGHYLMHLVYHERKQPPPD